MEEHHTPYYNQIRKTSCSTHHCSGQQDRQHQYKELRSLQFTRRSRASTQNAVCTNQNTQAQISNRDISMKHPLMPWIVRHSAYIMNRYAVHSNGCTSYFNRWNREQHTPLCEFGETVQHMLPTVKQFPKPEPRFYNGIWLGKDTTTGESLLGIYNRIVRARTIRRQILPHKYNQQQLDCVNTDPWKTPASALPTPTLPPQVTMPATSTAPPSQKDATTSTAAEGKRQSTSQASDQQSKQKKTAEPKSPMATSPTHQKRPALTAPPPKSLTRERDDTVAEGSTGKQQRTTAKRQALERPTTAEQPTGKMRINAIKFTTKDGKQIKTT